jgi:manganese transport protein
VVGGALGAQLSFVELASVLAGRLGAWAGPLFAVGLFAAGLSSAITAPLAAAITARALLAESEDDARWSDRSPRFRAVWGGLLAVGLAFGVSGVQPIPVIIVAQALNGVLLPVAAIALLAAVNDRSLMEERALNGPLSNALMVVVCATTVLLGVGGLARALARAAGLPPPTPGALLAIAALGTLVLAAPVGRAVIARRRGESGRGAPPPARG